MAHNIAKINGRDAMFCVGDRESAWHRLGQRTPNAVTWQEAMQLAELNWTVEKQQLFDQAGNPLPTYGIFRTDNNSFLGPVGERFTPMQNVNLFGFCDDLLEVANAGSHYESAGALGNGEKIWTLARIPSLDFAVGGDDKHETYLMACTGHDGSMRTFLKLTTVRVVCQNTMCAALSGEGASIAVKHTKNGQVKLESAIKAFKGIGNDAKVLQTKLEKMADFKLTRQSAESILNDIFPVAENKESSTRRDNILADVLNVYAMNDRNTYASIKGTGYNLLNAVIEYTDYERSVRKGGDAAADARKRAESALFGSGDTLKQKAMDVIYKLADGSEKIVSVMPGTPTSGSLLDQIISQQ